MERIRFYVFGLMLALGLLFCPSQAFASDGFLGGLEDLAGTREVKEQPDFEREFQEGYEPEFREVEPAQQTRTLPENATTVDYINDTVDSFNNSGWTGQGMSRRSLIESIPLLFTQSVMLRIFFSVAIGLVFVWWGVRKSKNMIIAAFRKGKATL